MSYFHLPAKMAGKRVKVLIIGAGGNGSILATQLAKMNTSLEAISEKIVGLDVTIADDDTVSLPNIGKQNFYPADIDKNKARVLVDRFNRWCCTDWEAIESRIDSSNIHIVNKYDIVFTCVDSPIFRFELGEFYADRESDTLWCDLGVEQFTGQVILGHLCQGISNPLPNVHTMYGDFLNREAHTESSCSTEEALHHQDFGVNDKAAIEAQQIFWQLIRHGKCSYVGQFFDIQTGECNRLKVMYPSSVTP